MTRLAPAALLAAAASLIFLPWPVSAALALFAAPAIPLAPLALGIMADALYFSPGVSLVPLASLVGAVASALALLLRARLASGIIAA